MKKKKIFLIIILIILIMFLMLLTSNYIRKQALFYKQEQLATELGISIKDYSFPDDFPTGYYGHTLQPGISYEEVHRKIKGYSYAFHCYSTVEVYYFFSLVDRNSIIIYVTYDFQGRFEKLVGGNSKSAGGPTINSIKPGGCEEGLLQFIN